MTDNKYLTPQLKEDNNPILAQSGGNMLSLNLA